MWTVILIASEREKKKKETVTAEGETTNIYPVF